MNTVSSLSSLWQVLPRELFFNQLPASGRSSPESGKTSPASSNSSFERVDIADSPTEGNQPTAWPIIQPPESSVSETFTISLSDLHNQPVMPLISFSGLALQYIFNLRDFMLSLDSNILSGETKLGLVTVLSLSTAVAYTFMTVEEALIRFTIGLVGIAVATPFALLLVIFSDINPNPNESMLFVPFSIGTTITVLGLWGGMQCLAQVATGFFAAYEMMTNTNPHMPKVSNLTNQATLGLQDKVVAFMQSPTEY